MTIIFNQILKAPSKKIQIKNAKGYSFSKESKEMFFKLEMCF